MRSEPDEGGWLPIDRIGVTLTVGGKPCIGGGTGGLEDLGVLELRHHDRRYSGGAKRGCTPGESLPSEPTLSARLTADRSFGTWSSRVTLNHF